MKRWTIGLTLVALVGGAVVMAQGDEAGLVPFGDGQAVAAGAQIYEEHCAGCHGGDLQGQANWKERDVLGYLPAPPHDASGHTWHHPDPLLFALTKFGTAAVVGDGYKSRMPGFGGVLSDEEILSVLAYIKSTWPERVIETHNRINTEAKAAGN